MKGKIYLDRTGPGFGLSTTLPKPDHLLVRPNFKAQARPQANQALAGLKLAKFMNKPSSGLKEYPSRSNSNYDVGVGLPLTNLQNIDNVNMHFFAS